MGAVYRVEHVMLKKELALKFLHPELGRLDEVARRFEREAEAAARLDHPNIIAVTDFGRTADGMLFLVMELLQGQSLTSSSAPAASGSRCPSSARCTSSGRSCARSSTRTPAASSIAISSPTTSCSSSATASATSSSCSTSASPRSARPPTASLVKR